MKAAVADFLAQRRIAVVGVSRSGNQPANAIYRRLVETGHEVIPVNPAATEIEGATCYADLASIPGNVDAVVVATPPSVSPQIVRECGELGIRRVWLHRSLGQGSFSAEAVRMGRERDMTIIPGGCPMMFAGSVDIAHRCLRWILGATGGLPKEV